MFSRPPPGDGADVGHWANNSVGVRFAWLRSLHDAKAQTALGAARHRLPVWPSAPWLPFGALLVGSGGLYSKSFFHIRWAAGQDGPSRNPDAHGAVHTVHLAGLAPLLHPV